MKINTLEAQKLIKKFRKQGIPYFFTNKVAVGITWRYQALMLLKQRKIKLLAFLRFCLPFWRGDRSKLNMLLEKQNFELMGDLKDITLEITSGHLMRPAISSAMGGYDLLYFYYQITMLDQYKIDDYIKEGSIVIDAGANIGMFSVNASLRGATVYAFEPVSIIASALRENTESFRVEVIEQGLGAAPGEKNIYFSPDALGSSTIEGSGMAFPDGSSAQKIKITTIDDFVRERGIRVDFIKMDVEGYEKEVLAGAKETIRKFHPTIVCSAYHHPEDKRAIPVFIDSTDNNYVGSLLSRGEDDFVFTAKGKV